MIIRQQGFQKVAVEAFALRGAGAYIADWPAAMISRVCLQSQGTPPSRSIPKLSPVEGESFSFLFSSSAFEGIFFNWERMVFLIWLSACFAHPFSFFLGFSKAFLSFAAGGMAPIG